MVLDARPIIFLINLWQYDFGQLFNKKLVAKYFRRLRTTIKQTAEPYPVLGPELAALSRVAHSWLGDYGTTVEGYPTSERVDEDRERITFGLDGLRFAL